MKTKIYSDRIISTRRSKEEEKIGTKKNYNIGQQFESDIGLLQTSVKAIMKELRKRRAKTDDCSLLEVPHLSYLAEQHH